MSSKQQNGRDDKQMLKGKETDAADVRRDLYLCGIARRGDGGKILKVRKR